MHADFTFNKKERLERMDKKFYLLVFPIYSDSLIQSFTDSQRFIYIYKNTALLRRKPSRFGKRTTKTRRRRSNFHSDTG